MTAPTDRPIEAVFAPEHQAFLAAAGLGDYAAVMSTTLGEPLIKPGLGGRERIRLSLTDADGGARTVYLKRYTTCPPAQREWRGLQAVHAAGVPTMAAMATGTGPRGGFVIVGEVPGDALSRRFDDILARRGDDDAAMTALAKGLGGLIGTFHAAKLAHRDFYADHVFVHEAGDAFELNLIDLARVFRPRWRHWRWAAKDLAQLKLQLPDAWDRQYWPTLWDAYGAARGATPPPGLPGTIDRRVRRMRARLARKAAEVQRKGT